jgi:hypothetical protein
VEALALIELSSDDDELEELGHKALDKVSGIMKATTSEEMDDAVAAVRKALDLVVDRAKVAQPGNSDPGRG